MSVFRKRLVIYIFRKLDRNSSGFIEESELTRFYKCSNLPEIFDGSITPKAKSKEFVQSIGTIAVPDGPEGRISLEQFIDYYLSMSLVFSGSDVEFRSEVLSEWRVEADSTDSPTPFVSLSPTQADGKSPSPPSSLVPSSSRNVSPRAKKVVTCSAFDQSEPGECDKQYKAVSNHQTSPVLRRGSTDHDQLSLTPRTQGRKFQSSHSPRRFSPPLQSQSRQLSPPATRDQDPQHTELPLTPIYSQHSQHHLQTYLSPFSPATTDFNLTVRTTDQIISDNLNYLLASLQQKVHEQQNAIEAQKQLIFTQQQTLDQLQKRQNTLSKFPTIQL